MIGKMKLKYITFFIIVINFKNGLSQSKQDIVELYQKYVFLDENFEFDGQKLHWPDLQKMYESKSTCREEEYPLDEKLTYYDCARKSDSRDYNVIVTDKKRNSFSVSHVDFFGIKNTLKEVETRSITTQVKEGKILNQLICDFDTKTKSFHVDIVDCECFLITQKTIAILDIMKVAENSNKEKPFRDFIEHISSPEYKSLFITRAERAYYDIYASINNNRLRHRYFENRVFDINQFKSPHDLISEREREHSTTFRTFDELKEQRDVVIKIGANMMSRGWRIKDLWGEK